MAIEDQRVDAASLLRELGHEFVARNLSEEQLRQLTSQLPALIQLVKAGAPRIRSFSSDRVNDVNEAIPEGYDPQRRQLFSDSIVSGGANPMGLDATLWREGDVAVMAVTLRSAFEGAPGRAHGGVITALLDETMGAVHVLNDALAYTAQLDVAFLASTPIGQPIVARAWLARREGRKLFIEATLHHEELELARATALFIAIEPAALREHQAANEA